jgi:membrane protein
VPETGLKLNAFYMAQKEKSLKYRLSVLLAVLRHALRLFLKHDPLRMAGATAFFTIFALPPILIIIFQTFSLIIDPSTLRTALFTKLSGTVGQEAMTQIVSIIRAFRSLTTKTIPVTILGFLFLLFVATTLFKVIRSSLDELWSIEQRPQRMMLTLGMRMQSIGIILLAGLLFTLDIAFEALEVLLRKYSAMRFPHLSVLFFNITGFVIPVIIVAFWFLIVFKYLSHARPSWGIAWAGSLFTSIFFLIGRIILHLLLSYNNINTIYGTSTSIVLILLYVFYISMILYFGAAFTRMWSIYKRKPFGALIG